MSPEITTYVPDPDTTSVPNGTYPYVFTASCAHRSGIEYVEVTQPQGSKYEFWRCVECQTEFRPTGERRG